MEEKAVEKTEVVESQELAPAVIDNGGAMLSDRFVENAERQIELRKKLLVIAIKACKPHDFHDFGGKPYLEGEGGARIMAVIRGFKVSEAKFVIEHISPHTFVDCSLPMEFMGATTVAIGDCSTADPFFTGDDGKGGLYAKHLKRTASDVMASRLLLGDAKKKARENAISRGVSELLGIKGLKWEDLEELGFKRSAAGSTVKFKAGANGAETKTVTIQEALSAVKGSTISVRGILQGAKERTIKKNDGSALRIADYQLKDAENNAITISTWGECIDGIKAGDTLYIDGILVGEYQGKPSYIAKSAQKVEVA